MFSCACSYSQRSTLALVMVALRQEIHCKLLDRVPVRIERMMSEVIYGPCACSFSLFIKAKVKNNGTRNLKVHQDASSRNAQILRFKSQLFWPIFIRNMLSIRRQWLLPIRIPLTLNLTEVWSRSKHWLETWFTIFCNALVIAAFDTFNELHVHVSTSFRSF